VETTALILAKKNYALLARENCGYNLLNFSRKSCPPWWVSCGYHQMHSNQELYPPGLLG
jgi:hypothetical protein